MTKLRKMWIYSPPKPPAPKVPARSKTELQEKADQLIETLLKPQHIKPMPKGYEWNYIVDIYAKWYRHYFYFCAKYRSPSSHALSPFFETRFARMEYLGRDRFNLSYMRHTGDWIMIRPNLSLDASLKAIREDPIFAP
ncbi:MAG: hypothetical protein M1570_18075 [Chloroflexi bacterium]|nr:hypothetical protein [Chloroflexota bacterium]